MKGNWNYPTAVRFGAGRIVELPSICAELGIANPLLVTDRGLADLDITKNAAELARAGVFSGVDGNPHGGHVEDGVRAYREGAHDGVIAFGGGSALDVAKCVALMVGQDRPLWDFEDVGDNWTRVDVAGMAPVVAVPTTSGTGSEVGRASVIVERATYTKRIIFHPNMLPARVLADPELTIGLPARITGWTGIDALSHNLEAFCAPGFHPMADGIAAEGIRLCFAYLTRAVEDGTDIEARSAMMAASSMGATAFQKGLGGMHALSHPIGAVYNTHHGLTNGVVMPYVLRHNESAIADRLADVARYAGLGDSFADFVDAVLALREKTFVPATLQDIGVPADAAARIGPLAALDPSAGGNPLPLDGDILTRLCATCLGS